MASLPVKQTPAAPPTETLEERFRRLATAWHEAVAYHSSTTVRNNHPAYREIISLGPERCTVAASRHGNQPHALVLRPT